MAIEFEGMDVVISKMEDIASAEKLQQAITTATLYLEGEVAKKAPKGEIQQSIASKVEDGKGTVYSNNRLAPYVEYGTGKFSEHPMGGRKEVPWVYVEGQSNEPSRKTIHTEYTADRAVKFLRSQGLPAVKTYGSKPQPFMRPALDENRDTITGILGEALVSD